MSQVPPATFDGVVPRRAAASSLAASWSTAAGSMPCSCAAAPGEVGAGTAASVPVDEAGGTAAAVPGEAPEEAQTPSASVTLSAVPRAMASTTDRGPARPVCGMAGLPLSCADGGRALGSASGRSVRGTPSTYLGSGPRRSPDVDVGRGGGTQHLREARAEQLRRLGCAVERPAELRLVAVARPSEPDQRLLRLARQVGQALELRVADALEREHALEPPRLQEDVGHPSRGSRPRAAPTPRSRRPLGGIRARCLRRHVDGEGQPVVVDEHGEVGGYAGRPRLPRLLEGTVAHAGLPSCD